MNAGVRDPITELRTFVNPSAWQTITEGANYTTASSGRCRLTGEHVFLRGTMVRNSGNLTSAETIGTLPSGYRPTQTHTCNITDSSTPGSFRISISTAGVITVTVISGSGSQAVLDGVNFSTT
jgi:hypothetical protein